MNKKLNVLVACEESQRVCMEFRKLGHNAFSCDIQECSGGHPEWHIKGDCFPIINLTEKRVFFGEPVPVFYTQDGERHILPNHIKWDLIIAFPPCTYLARSGSKYLNEVWYGDYAVERKKQQELAIEFFLKIASIDNCPIAIENPIGCMDKKYRKCDQIIQPWNFGDNVSKSTCLWLKGLPALTPQVTEKPDDMDNDFFYRTRFLPAEERRKQRSKTFPGIAKAMAEQWSEYLLSTIS